MHSNSRVRARTDSFKLPQNALDFVNSIPGQERFENKAGGASGGTVSMMMELGGLTSLGEVSDRATHGTANHPPTLTTHTNSSSPRPDNKKTRTEAVTTTC